MTLSKFNDPRAVEAIYDCFDDENPDIHELSVIKLGEKKDQRSVIPLLNLLNEDKTENEDDVIEILGNLQVIMAVEPIIKKLKDEDLKVRLSSAEALGTISNERAIEPLMSLLKDENPMLREKAVKALKKINSSQAVLPVIAALNDSDMKVRDASVQALGVFKDTRAVEPLISLFKIEKRRSIKKNAALALSIINDPVAVGVLINALDDKRYDSDYLALALTKFKTPQAEDALSQLFQKSDWEAIEGAHNYYIAKYAPGNEKKIIKALKKTNSPSMAHTMKRSGNAMLRKAAEEWIDDNQLH